jgi:hypothetical protein
MQDPEHRKTAKVNRRTKNLILKIPYLNVPAGGKCDKEKKLKVIVDKNGTVLYH